MEINSIRKVNYLEYLSSMLQFWTKKKKKWQQRFLNIFKKDTVKINEQGRIFHSSTCTKCYQLRMCSHRWECYIATLHSISVSTRCRQWSSRLWICQMACGQTLKWGFLLTVLFLSLKMTLFLIEQICSLCVPQSELLTWLIKINF